MSESKKEQKAHKKAYATLDEAKAVPLPGDNYRVYQVTSPGGKVVYVVAWGVEAAIITAARCEGYKASVAEPKGAGPLTQERVSSFLANMSPEDRAVLIAQYAPALKGKGKGKE
jgi:hypothetical protein